MWRHYKALKKTAYDRRGMRPGRNWIWLTLARAWKMPVRQVKNSINARKSTAKTAEE